MFSLGTILLSISGNANSQETLTAKQIADKSYQATKLAGSEAASTLTIIDAKGRERVRQIAQVTKLYNNGETEKRLVRFLAPADVKGTGLLTFDYATEDDDLWLFMPALRKTRRIVSSEKAKSFMGSEFSYADMTPPNLEDFNYKMLEDALVGETPCRQIEMTPINEDVADENGFSRKISFIGKSDFVIRKAHYYDLDGELLKELSIGEIRLLDPENKRYRAMELTMVNLQNDRKSIMKVDIIQFNPNIKDEYFTVRYLERQ